MEIDVGKIHDRVKQYWKDIKSQFDQLSNKNPPPTGELNRLQLILNDKDYYTLDYLQLRKEQEDIKTNKPISFMEKRVGPPNQEYTKKYIDLLHKYNLQTIIHDEIKINTCGTGSVGVDKPVKKKCVNCNEKEFITNTEHNTEICCGCGIQTEKSDNFMSYKELSRINTSIKYKYERHVHFKDAMNQFQGKQNVTILPIVYQDINNLIHNNHMDRSKITREQINLLLKITGHTKHYEDVSLIYHRITGKPIADISHLEDKLLNDFEQVSETYDLLFKSDQTFERKSFINTHYILYQLLKKHKFPCSKQDFNILKTLDRKAFHDEVGQKIFEYLEWNLTPLF